MLALIVVLGITLLPGCAHVTNVATTCQGTITQSLIDDTAAALAKSDYESALLTVGINVLPCLLVATVREIVDVTGGKFASPDTNTAVVHRHGLEWLSIHGG